MNGENAESAAEHERVLRHQGQQNTQQHLWFVKQKPWVPGHVPWSHGQSSHFGLCSFQGSFFLENLRTPRENGWLLKRTMLEKNGKGISP